MKKIHIYMFIVFICTIVTGCTETISTDSQGNSKKEFAVDEVALVNKTKVKINSIKKIYSECSWEYNGECYSKNEPDGDFFLLIDLTLENTSDKELNISSLLQFDLKSPNGEKANQEIMLNAIKSSLDGGIMSNDILKGQIAFDVNEEDYYYFYYKDGFLDDNVKFVINKSDIRE